MHSRRSFIKGLVRVAAGIVIAPDALELTKHFWPGADFNPRFAHKTFGLGFEVTQEMIQNDLYGDLSVRSLQKSLEYYKYSAADYIARPSGIVVPPSMIEVVDRILEP